MYIDTADLVVGDVIAQMGPSETVIAIDDIDPAFRMVTVHSNGNGATRVRRMQRFDALIRVTR